MRLVAWNVAGRTDGPRAPGLSQQAEAIADEYPDLVALQEVTRASNEPWRTKLSDIGLTHIVGTVAQLTDGRRYANLLAARWPLTPDRPCRDTEFPEKILSAHIQAPDGDVELHLFHAPTGVGSGWGKVRALEALHRRLLGRRPAARIVCGDFNAPQAEPPGRPLLTFAQDPETEVLLDRPPRWFAVKDWPEPWDAERWDRAERQVLGAGQLEQLGLIDGFRLLHPNATDASWVWRGRGREVPRRFDHVLASQALRPLSVAYRHAWREPAASGQRLSDHSGIVAEFQSVTLQP